MDTYQATKTLTGKLAEHFGRLIVSDGQYKKYLVEKARHVYAVGNPIDVVMYRDKSEIIYTKNDADNNHAEGCDLEKVISKFIPAEANYLFSSAKIKMSECRIVFDVTPYSIIGDKELESLQSMFYKAYDTDVKEALDTLGIKDFFWLYQSYFNNSPDFQKMLFNKFETFKKELLDFLKDRKYDGGGDTRLDAFEYKFGLHNLNSQFKKLGINFTLPVSDSYIKKPKVDMLAKLIGEHSPFLSADGTFSLKFLKFVFSLPCEDQNLEVNKSLIKEFNYALDLKTLLLKEFKQGNHFKEYFELLENNEQEDIARAIKQSGFQNQVYNSFLWSKGFKDISLDYLRLYKENSENFIEYFKNRNIAEKKVIIKDIMDCESINDEVVEWLNKNELDLIREVGFND